MGTPAYTLSSSNYQNPAVLPPQGPHSVLHRMIIARHHIPRVPPPKKRHRLGQVGTPSSSLEVSDPLLMDAHRTAMIWALTAAAALATSAPVAARLSSTRGLAAALGAALRSKDPSLVSGACALVGNLAAHRASQALIGVARGVGREVVRGLRDAREAATVAVALGEGGREGGRGNGPVYGVLGGWSMELANASVGWVHVLIMEDCSGDHTVSLGMRICKRAIGGPVWDREAAGCTEVSKLTTN